MNDFFKNSLKNAKSKNVQETFDYLNNLESEKTFKIQSNSQYINNTEIRIRKGNRCYKFFSNSLNSVQKTSNNNEDGFGYFKRLKFYNSEENWICPYGADHMDFTVENETDKISIEGEILSLESSFDKSNKKFYRQILQTEFNPNINYTSFIRGEGFAVGETYVVTGLTIITCNGNLIHLFNYDINKRYFIFIDSMNPIYYEDFKKSVEAILYSIGTITGYVPRNEKYIFQSVNNEFKTISGFKYLRMEETVTSEMHTVSPRLFSEFSSLKEEKAYVGIDILSNMTTKAFLDNRFLRALKIISECNAYPLEIRASAYSVALETVKNIINEENEEKINPFKDKRYAKNLIKELKENIKSIDISYFNNKEAVLNRIEQLNQVSNKDSFIIAFSLCGFKLLI
jgi:hypothetical protein